MLNISKQCTELPWIFLFMKHSKGQRGREISLSVPQSVSSGFISSKNVLCSTALEMSVLQSYYICGLEYEIYHLAPLSFLVKFMFCVLLMLALLP